MKPHRLVASFFAMTLAATASAQIVQWTTASGGNGHYYEAVLVPSGISWTQARNAAQSRGGYLATPTSAAENNFVFQRINQPQYWNQEPAGGSNLGPWLGAYQTFDNGSTPSANWVWVTGEPWSYTNWYSGEPNNFLGSGEDYLSFKCHGTANCRSSGWNDLPDAISTFGTAVKAYVIEYDALPAAASCAVRNGSGVNPLDCQCNTLPIVGTTWSIRTTPNAGTVFTAVLLAFQPAPAPLPMFGGEVLIDTGAMFQMPGSGVHTLSVPTGTAWIGFPVFAQGARFDVVSGAVQIVLLNGLDAVFGI